MWRYIFILVVTISTLSSARKLGGSPSDGHHHDHHHHHGEHHHPDHGHDHVDQDTEIQALESSIESVYASFDGTEEDTSVDVYDYEEYEGSFDYVYNVINDNSVEGLDKSRYRDEKSHCLRRYSICSLELCRPPWTTGR